MPANLENSAVATGLENIHFNSYPKESQCQRMLKPPHNCTHLILSKVMLKIFQEELKKYMNHELPDIQAGFRKCRITRNQITNIHWIIKKAREFQKNIFCFFIDSTREFDMWIIANCGKFFKIWETRPLYLAPEKSTCRSKSNS